jgi:hypothetical protein
MSRQLPATLTKLQTLAKGEQWDDIITACKVLKPLKLKYLGYSSAPQLASALGETGETVESGTYTHINIVAYSYTCTCSRVYSYNAYVYFHLL